MATVKSQGLNIVYDILNAGAARLPIFLIAGLNGMRSSFRVQAPLFARDRPVVLHDHRGTGASDKPLGVYTVENMAADVIAIMDAAGIRKAHMVGTSTGGAIAQVLCLDYPERVQSAAICCSWTKADPFFRRQFEMRKRVLRGLGTEALIMHASTMLNDPKYFSENYEAIVAREKVLLENASPPDVEAERIDCILAFDQTARLSRIAVPVTVIGSKNDAVCPPYYSVELAEAIPGAQLKLYEDGGHFFYNVYAERFVADITAFVTKHD